MAAFTFQDFLDGFKDLGEDAKNAMGALGEFGEILAKVSKTVLSFNDSNNQLLMGLNKQISVNQTIIHYYQELTKQSLVLEQRNKQINKSFGVGVKQAALLSQEFQKVAQALGISGEQTAKYGGSIKKMLPTLNQATSAGKDFYIGMQQTQHMLQTNLQLTEDQANAYTQYAMQNGANAASMMKATQAISDAIDPGGTMGYTKMITEEIANTGNEIQLQYGKIPGNLEMAVLKAKKLGFSLEDLAGTADNLLDIESSIGQELEYQLLSGHRLVDQQGNSLTNLYRESALRGDMNKQADVLNDILENEGDVLETNMFARKQLAATLGMEERQLASALQKKKILDKAASSGVEINLDGTNALQEAAAAVEAGAITDEEFKKLRESMDTRTTDEIQKEQLTVANEQKMISLLTLYQAELTNNNQKAVLENSKELGENLLGWTDNQMKLVGKLVASEETIKAAGGAASNIWTGIPQVESGLQYMRDAVIPAGYGSRILSFPEDTLQAPIAFNDNDTIVAGTNLAGKSGGSSGADMTQFAAMIVAAINNQTRALKSDATFSGGINAPYYG